MADTTAALIWRDYTSGPGSDPYDPPKSDIRPYLTRIESVVGTTASLSRRQIILALADVTNPAGANVYPIVANAIDPLCGDAASAQWAAHSPLYAGDALAILIATATGWSGPQMTTFLTLAATKTL